MEQARPSDLFILPRIPAGAAALAAGISVKVLQGWTDPGRAPHDRVALLGDPEREPQKWRRFSPIDVVRLAVIGRLLRYGFTVAEANKILADTLDVALFALVSYRDLPISFVLDRLHNFVIFAARTPTGIVAKWRNRMAQDAPGDSFLTVDVGLIAEGLRPALKQIGAYQ